MEAIGLTLPIVREGDDLAGLILRAATEEGLAIEDGDILVVTEKILAKAQGRVVRLDSVTPSEEARALARKTGKDPRLVELILSESREVLAAGDGFLITETLEGFVCANAGIDQSNVEEGFVKLLPEGPDKAAEEIRLEVEKRTGKKVGVVISDSFGRPFRCGSVGVAIGASGVKALWDRRGEADLYGRTLQSTRVAVGDLIASTANLVSGDADEKTPVVLIRGLKGLAGNGRGADLIRSREQDMFRRKV
ncbi:MAG: coenzyme F420-0:L-glutamate ligase [Methanobacteriota archaeon]|nr:MAG: coenzyme F420-0:L-glutamate ligase [Euryarchaeota archaeon]